MVPRRTVRILGSNCYYIICGKQNGDSHCDLSIRRSASDSCFRCLQSSCPRQNGTSSSSFLAKRKTSRNALGFHFVISRYRSRIRECFTTNAGRNALHGSKRPRVVLNSAPCEQGEKKYSGYPEYNACDQQVDLQRVQHGSLLPVAGLATDSIDDEQKTCDQQN